MSFSEKFVQVAQRVLPTPFTIAILLTFFTILLALLFTSPKYNRVEINCGEQKSTVVTGKQLSFAHPDTSIKEKLHFDFSAKGKLGVTSEMQSKASSKDQINLNNLSGLEISTDGTNSGASLYKKNSAANSNNSDTLQIAFAPPMQIIQRLTVLDSSLNLYPQKAFEMSIAFESGLEVKLKQGCNGQWYPLQLLSFWEGGFFNFLKFAMQMMLILVLGHVLALTRPVNAVIQALARQCTSTPKAAYIVTLVSILVAFFNWGLALVVGAIFARKVGEYAAQNGIVLNYALVGAAGYSGLMVWHGGLSGSAPLIVAESNHKFVNEIGQIPFSDTIFSNMNLVCMAVLLLFVPLAMYWLGRRMPGQQVILPPSISMNLSEQGEDKPEGAERLDHSRLLASFLGGLMVFIGLYKVILLPVFINGQGFDWQFRFINPNYIIFMLFGLAILLHGSFKKFNFAVGEGIGGSAGIMIQFPLYAGIMGIMIDSGLVNVFSNMFVHISNPTTFPLFTFFSAGMVNVFVPSGGGQWLVQGPILIEASQSLGVPIEKSIMALCYGDQITNMLQPFWALPLLGITGLKAKEILPYTAFLLLVGTLIFCTILLIF